MGTKATIGVEEMARRLGICRNTAYLLANKCNFYPAYKVGKKICIDTDLLEQWIKEQGRVKESAGYNNKSRD